MDVESYFLRAELYEKVSVPGTCTCTYTCMYMYMYVLACTYMYLYNLQRGELESALSDYAKVSELQPSNMEAITRQAMHKFKKG